MWSHSRGKESTLTGVSLPDRSSGEVSRWVGVAGRLPWLRPSQGRPISSKLDSKENVTPEGSGSCLIFYGEEGKRRMDGGQRGIRGWMFRGSPHAGSGAGGNGPACWKPPGSTSGAPPARPRSTLHPEVNFSWSDPLRTRSGRRCAPCSAWSPSGNSGQRQTMSDGAPSKPSSLSFHHLTLSCCILWWTSLSEKCSTLVSCRSSSVSHTSMLFLVPSNSSRWPVKCCPTEELTSTPTRRRSFSRNFYVPWVCGGWRSPGGAAGPSAGSPPGPWPGAGRLCRFGSPGPGGDTGCWEFPTGSNVRSLASGCPEEETDIFAKPKTRTWTSAPWRPAETNPSSAPLQTDLKLHKFLFGEREGNICRVGVGSSCLSDLKPVLKARVVVEEFAPESPRLLDPDGGATLLLWFTFS